MEKSSTTGSRVFITFSFLITILGLIFFCLMLGSCTLSFQNIDTHGTATDLVDENQSASPDIKPVTEIPLR